MLNLVLHSSGNDDGSVLDYARAQQGDEIALATFVSDTTAPSVTRNRYSFAETRVFPACHLTRWTPAVASLMQNELRRDRETVVIDTDFAHRHSVKLDGFLAVARFHDFFAVNGRFRLEGGRYRFSFPTWDCGYFAARFWNTPEIWHYLRYLKPVQDEYGEYYAMQYFFEHFRKSFDLGCLIDDQPMTAFDPLNGRDVDIDGMIARRLAARPETPGRTS